MKPQEHIITAIVPVYNEEKFLRNLLNSILAIEGLDEIICVNDGSNDLSAEILDEYSADLQVIHLTENKGKGNALAVGIKAAKGDIILFLDADLKNLQDEHVHSLVEPILEKKSRAVVGYCATSARGSNLAEYISGQRAYLKEDLMPHVEEMEDLRFGIEMYLNTKVNADDTEFVPLIKLRSAYKYEKYPPEVAIMEYFKEGKEIMTVLPRTVLSIDFLESILEKIRIGIISI